VQLITPWFSFPHFSFLSSFSRCLGAHNKIALSQHSRNETIPKGFESSFGSYSTIWSHIFDRLIRTERRNGKENFRYCTSCFVKYTGEHKIPDKSTDIGNLLFLIKAFVIQCFSIKLLLTKAWDGGWAMSLRQVRDFINFSFKANEKTLSFVHLTYVVCLRSTASLSLCDVEQRNSIIYFSLVPLFIYIRIKPQIIKFYGFYASVQKRFNYFFGE
jgi:hypothetical protein